MKALIIASIALKLCVFECLYAQQLEKFKLPDNIRITSVSWWVAVDGADDKLISMSMSDKTSNSIIALINEAMVVYRGSKKVNNSAITTKFGRRLITYISSIGVPGAVTIEGCFMIDYQGKIFEPLDLEKPDLLLDKLDTILTKN